jgi:transcription elongation factor GreB
VANYVTPRGLALLRAERERLEAERARLNAAADDGRKRDLAVVAGRLADLDARLASAKVVDPASQPREEVRFGATVTLRTLEGERPGEERQLTLVGVDEADAAEGRVAFTAPVARAVLGKRVGEKATLRTARGEERLEVVAIAYEAGAPA